MSIPEFAQYLAAAIFHESGSHGNDRTQRIAFKGGKYPGAETDLGGLCREALRERIDAAIKKRPRFLPDDPVGVAYDRIRTAMDLPADCDPADVARAVEEVLSAFHGAAAAEDYPAGMPAITQQR